ncbi:acetaldehyde dehydrogenase (acetylating) [soil metagenome]
MADKVENSNEEAGNAVEAAFHAFLSLRTFGQETVDAICDAMSAAALAESGRLGMLAHTETGFGNAEDKREKNRFAAEDVWKHFRSLKTVGVVSETKNIVEIASPRGVVAAIIPSTNPTSTAIFKILIAIKSRNSIVLSPHPSAAKSIAETTRVMKDAAVAGGLPPDAIWCIENPTIEGTEALMRHRRTAVILATGGIGLVRAAYSSGKPAFGVGPGNVPVFIDRSADVPKAVSDILTGTCFDNGTICASEQSVVVDRPVEDQVRKEFAEQGAYFLDRDAADAVARVLLTPERTLNPGIVGRSAEYIAQLAGVVVPKGTRCLLADCDGVGRDHPWSIEKLSPTLAFFVADGLVAGANRCEEILQFGGMGHTAGVHSQDRAAAIKFGEQMPASRVVINSPTTHGAIGLSTDLPPSMTLGCGSWGGNVTSDNVSPIHLLDIKRVAFETKPVNRPGKPAARPRQESEPTPSASVPRDKIAAIVDHFLSKKIGEPSATRSTQTPTQQKPYPVSVDSPVKTVIHELKPQSLTENGIVKTPVDFVSENDVRAAVEKGEKIYISAKTILTPSARDLGEEKEIFARV